MPGARCGLLLLLSAKGVGTGLDGSFPLLSEACSLSVLASPHPLSFLPQAQPTHSGPSGDYSLHTRELPGGRRCFLTGKAGRARAGVGERLQHGWVRALS
jgi:hypothetical protein